MLDITLAYQRQAQLAFLTSMARAQHMGQAMRLAGQQITQQLTVQDGTH